MTHETASQIAERLNRTRARALPVLAIVFIAQQAAYFPGTDDALRSVDLVRSGAWVLLSVLLLAGIGTGGAWFQSPKVKAILNDEVTREHKQRACQVGFWAATVAAICLYIVAAIKAVSAQAAIHVILTAAIAAALLTFAQRERLALKDD